MTTARQVLRRARGAIASRLFGTLTHVVTNEPVAALTFDDGPHPQHTVQILRILEAHRAQGTFFMVGEAAGRCPDIVRRVAQGNHAIGNHSWDHPAFRALNGSKRRAQIRACQQALAPFGQRLFRPPYGWQSLPSRLDALWLGYQVVAWSLDVKDWVKDRPEVIAAELQERLCPGSIVLLHDAVYRPSAAPNSLSREPTIEAVRLLLDRIGRRYRFLTVPQLVNVGRPFWANWYRS